jgi:GntR family transcriptional regulator
MVMPNSPIPLYLQIEEELRGLIQSGELGPLARVPSEAELSASFKVSRMTARKALDRLVADGLMFRRAGKGTFVAQPKIAHGPSQLLSWSAAMNAQGVRHSTQVLDAGIVPAPTNIAGDLGLTPGVQVVLVRRLRLIEDQPAAIHMSYVPIRYASILQGDLTGSLTDLMIAAGARVAYTNDLIESVVARGDTARLLQVPSGAALVFISGVAYSENMEPLRHSEALYRGDRFRFRVDTTGTKDLRMEHKTAGATAPTY